MFRKIILFIIITIVFFLTVSAAANCIRELTHINIENYPVSTDYGILSEKQRATFDDILEAYKNGESKITTSVYSEKEQHEIITQLGIHFGDTEDSWDLVQWTGDEAILDLSKFETLSHQKIIIDARIDEALSTLIEGSDRYKVRQIVRYISQRMVFSNGFRNPIDALNGRGICESYAMLFYKMTFRLGIAGYICYGYTESGGYHAWNTVALDGEFLYFDITWHDAYVYDRRYIFSKNSWDRIFLLNNRWAIDLY